MRFTKREKAIHGYIRLVVFKFFPLRYVKDSEVHNFSKHDDVFFDWVFQGGTIQALWVNRRHHSRRNKGLSRGFDVRLLAWNHTNLMDPRLGLVLFASTPAMRYVMKVIILTFLTIYEGDWFTQVARFHRVTYGSHSGCRIYIVPDVLLWYQDVSSDGRSAVRDMGTWFVSYIFRQFLGVWKSSCCMWARFSANTRKTYSGA